MMDFPFCGSQSASEGPEKEREEKLTEAGYYSWQEKIMNGHSLFPSLPLLSLHMSSICGWKKSSEHWIIFLLTVPEGGSKYEILGLRSPKRLCLMLSIQRLQTGIFSRDILSTHADNASHTAHHSMAPKQCLTHPEA